MIRAVAFRLRNPGVNCDFNYRTQTKFAKVMFLHMSVSHSVHGWGGVPGQVPLLAGTPPWADTPLVGTPPGRYTPLAGTPPGRYTPWQVHPLAGTPLWQVHPPPQEQWMLGDTGIKRAFLLEMFKLNYSKQ